MTERINILSGSASHQATTDFFMKRWMIALSIFLPAAYLLFAVVFPDLDPVLQAPLPHFYIVTFFTFVSVVVTFLTAVVLGRSGMPRHRLLATAFAVMGVLMFVHGVMTPGALVFTFNPGIRWAAWLTLFLGGFIFAIASFDTPERPLSNLRLHRIHLILGVFIGAFIVIVAFFPDWLAAVDEQMDPWHQQAAFMSTLLFWLFAAWRFVRIYRITSNRVDGGMALIAVWFVVAALSMHGFENWHLSWWLYHVLLLMGVATAVVILAQAYEELREFQLTYYYAAIGLILTVGLALISAYLVSRFVERNMPYDEAELMVEMLVSARLTGFMIAGLTMSLLFLALFFVVRRADRLISIRNQELAQAYADLQASEAMRDDLADMMVHDLRSPLTAISLNLDLLERAVKDPGKASYRLKFIESARHSVTQMIGLVSQILSVAKLEAGQLNPNFQPLDVAELLVQKTAVFRPQAEANSKKIHCWTESSLPMPFADKELIGRVLDNLISNALKYTYPGGSIHLRAEFCETAVLVQVQDDGEGINPEVATLIFDKFYQVMDESGQPRRHGTGLGLAFCKLVVEAHQGKIWVNSKPEEGSSFSFTLPLNPS